jgi:hypothetical protein
MELQFKLGEEVNKINVFFHPAVLLPQALEDARNKPQSRSNPISAISRKYPSMKLVSESESQYAT